MVSFYQWFMLHLIFRIHGHKVAEMPLVATPFQYRRQGMCRLLLQELEQVVFLVYTRSFFLAESCAE